MTNQANKQLTVRIVSPQGIVYDHHAYSCTVKALDGGMTILPNHAPIMAALDISAVTVKRVTTDTQQDFIAINGGVLEMRDNHCEIVTSYGVRARDIDAARVQLEKQEAEAEMKAAISNEDAQAFRRAKVALERAINMISVSQKRRN